MQVRLREGIIRCEIPAGAWSSCARAQRLASVNGNEVGCE